MSDLGWTMNLWSSATKNRDRVMSVIVWTMSHGQSEARTGGQI